TLLYDHRRVALQGVDDGGVLLQILHRQRNQMRAAAHRVGQTAPRRLHFLEHAVHLRVIRDGADLGAGQHQLRLPRRDRVNRATTTPPPPAARCAPPQPERARRGGPPARGAPPRRNTSTCRSTRQGEPSWRTKAAAPAPGVPSTSPVWTRIARTLSSLSGWF